MPTLEEMKKDVDKLSSSIARLVNQRIEVLEVIEDLKYLQKHAGTMLFVGKSGRINEKDITLKTIRINSIGGCVSVPALLLGLAEEKLIEIEAHAKRFTEQHRVRLGGDGTCH